MCELPRPSTRVDLTPKNRGKWRAKAGQVVN